MENEYVYSDFTYNSKNPLVRFSHRTRFTKSVGLVLDRKFKSILDYGAGDNKFLKELSLLQSNIELNAFEPVMDTEKSEVITTYTRIEDLRDKKFDVITCFETFEHFNESAQSKMLEGFEKMLNDGGRIVISVPIEIGFPSIVKNINRMRLGRTSYEHFKNAVKCFFGRDVPEIRQLEGFIYSHIGFNHKKLEKIFSRHFQVLKKETSPFKNLSYQFNSQVFYVLEK